MTFGCASTKVDWICQDASVVSLEAPTWLTPLATIVAALFSLIGVVTVARMARKKSALSDAEEAIELLAKLAPNDPRADDLRRIADREIRYVAWNHVPIGLRVIVVGTGVVILILIPFGIVITPLQLVAVSVVLFIVTLLYPSK